MSSQGEKSDLERSKVVSLDIWFTLPVKYLRESAGAEPHLLVLAVDNQQVSSELLTRLLCCAPAGQAGGQQVAAALEGNPSFPTRS